MSGILRRSITLSPKSTFFFIVGVCAEWESKRELLGDKALAKVLRQSCSIPEEHICHIKDGQATKSNILKGLERLLNQTCVGDTLEIYFGGHGVPEGVGTVDGKLWKYVEIIQQIEKQFGGDRAVFLFDTCHAGWLGMHLKSRSRTLRVSYAFIGATQSDSVAGGQWTLTSSLIDAIQGKAGLDRFQDGVIDFADFVSYAADRHAKDKRNRISVRLFGKFRPNTILFKITNNVNAVITLRPLWPGDNITKITNKIFSINDNAFVKYEGGYEQQKDKSVVYIPPNWYPCKIQHIEQGNFAIVDVKDEFGNTWNMSLSPPNFLPDNYFSHAVRKGKTSPMFGIYRASNRIISETKKVMKNIIKEAANTSNPIKKRAGNVLLESTFGAMSVGFACLDTGAELLQQHKLVQKTPMLANMMQEHHNRAKERRRRAAANAKTFFKNFL
jgi:hypothetical protein